MVGFDRYRRAGFLLTDDHVTCEHDSLGHEHFDDVEEQRIGIELKHNQVQYVLFLFTQLILFGVESLVGWMHRMAWRYSAHGAHALIIHLLLKLLLLLARLVSGQLPQEFPRAGNRWVHLVIFCRNEKAGEALQHDHTLLHVFVVELSLLLRQEEVEDVD